MLGLGWWAAYIMYFRASPLDYASYSHARNWLAAPLCLFALACTIFFGTKHIFEDKTSVHLNGWSISLLLFWALFPPLWFFVEYFAIYDGRIAADPKIYGPDLPSQIKTFADFSAKIWAAFAVVYGFTTQAQIKRREEERKNTERGIKPWHS